MIAPFSFTEYFDRSFAFPKCITLHFVLLNFSCHSSDHLRNYFHITMMHYEFRPGNYSVTCAFYRLTFQHFRSLSASLPSALRPILHLGRNYGADSHGTDYREVHSYNRATIETMCSYPLIDYAHGHSDKYANS